MWASWCEPCLFELPFLQRQAVERGAQVAFLGVNSGDNSADARKLAARFPMPYPSFEDPRQNVAGRYGALGLPATAFYDARGKLVTSTRAATGPRPGSPPTSIATRSAEGGCAHRRAAYSASDRA